MTLLDQLVVLAFLIATFGFGVFGGRRDRRQRDSGVSYLLAGRRLSLPAFVATTVSTWYGGVLGVGEYGFRYGLSNWLVFGVPYYVAAALFAFALARRARREAVLTIPEQVHRVYGARAGGLAAVVVLATTLPAAYILTLAILVRSVFGLPLWVGVTAATIFSVLYLWRGGFAAVVRTDYLQFALMYGGFAVLVATLVMNYGGLEALEGKVPDTHWSWNGGAPIQSVLVWYVIALTTLVEPTFYQRAFAARTPAVARGGLLLSIGCWAVFDAMTTTAALYARALLTDLPAARAAEAFPLLAQLVLPVGLVGLFFVAMFATVMSTVDSYLFVVASTFGRDLLGRTRRFRERIPTATRLGLVVGGAATLALALASESVVDLWHDLGTVGACTLLVPVVGAFVPRVRMSSRGALLHMALVLPFTILWLASPALSAGEYWLGVEPIFPGLALGAAIWLADRGWALGRRAR